MSVCALEYQIPSKILGPSAVRPHAWLQRLFRPHPGYTWIDSPTHLTVHHTQTAQASRSYPSVTYILVPHPPPTDPGILSVASDSVSALS